jgi:hypothetical protein
MAKHGGFDILISVSFFFNVSPLEKGFVLGAMRMADGWIRNLDEVISELVDFWKKHAA